MNKVKIPFDKLKKDMLVVDEDGMEGIVIYCEDIHNVEINFTDNGEKQIHTEMGFASVCLVESCSFYSPLYYPDAQEHHSEVIESLFIKQPNIEDYKGDGSTMDYIHDTLEYIEQLKRGHEIEVEMFQTALQEANNKIKNFETWVEKLSFKNDES
jgi:hypothetical protein